MAPTAVAEVDDLPFEITADVLEFDSAERLYLGEGHVRIVQAGGKRSLDADWVVFSNETRRGAASGNVVMRSGGDVVVADFAVFDVDSLEGMVWNGALHSPGDQKTALRLRARELVKTGADTYDFEEGGFTTCNCPDPESRDPWRIRADEGDIEVGGYGVFRNATLDVMEVPVLWVPWMAVPIKTKRETGILFPELSQSSRRGWDIGLPIFFAIGDPVNLTLTPRWLSNRGFKQDAELEYVFGRKSWGRMAGAFLHDDEVNSQNNARFGADRYYFRFQSQTWLPADWRVTSDYNLISDNDYVDDFDEMALFRRDRYLESSLFAFNQFGADGRLGFLGSLQTSDDLQSPDDRDRDDFVLHRLPHIQLDWLAGELPKGLSDRSGLVVRMDTGFTHWRAWDDPEDEVGFDAQKLDQRFFDTGFDALPNSREDPNPERLRQGAPLLPDPNQDNFDPNGGPEGDSVFQEGEPLADEGGRWLFHPRIARPFRAGGLFEVNPEIGYLQALYYSDNQQFNERGAVTGRVDLLSRFSRRFDLGPADPKPGVLSARQGPLMFRWLEHVVEPGVSYVYVNARNQGGDPIFVPRTATPQRRVRQLVPENALSDPADRLAKRNAVIFTLGNRLYMPSPVGRLLVADIDISADVDFEDGGFGLFVVDGRTYRAFGVNTLFNLTVDPDRERIDEGLIDVTYKLPGKGPFGLITDSVVGLRYRYLRDIPLFFESFRGDNRGRFSEFREGFDEVSQIDFRARLNLGNRIVLGGGLSYTFADNIFLRNFGSIDYVSPCRCWALGFQATESRERGHQFSLRYTLLGPGDDIKNPFGGSRFGLQSGLP